MKVTSSYKSFCGVRKLCRSVLKGLVIAMLGATCHAATYSWSGGSASDGNWSDSANWGFVGTPANGDTVIFPGGVARLTNTNNIVGLTLNQIVFVGASGGYQIFGNGFTITNGILVTNTAGANSFSMTNSPISIATTDLSIVVSNGVSLTIWAPLNSLTGIFGLVKNGTGTLNLAGPLSNTYGGTTTVNAGVLNMEKLGVPAATAIPGTFVIGDGSDSVTVNDLEGIQLAQSGIAITVNADGVLNLNGWLEYGGPSITLNGNATIENSGLDFFSGTTVTANPGFLENCSISGNLSFGGPFCDFVVNGGFLDGSLVVSAGISGTAVINKTGTGFLDFSGPNSFNSQLNVLDGTLGAESSQALGAISSSTTVSNTAMLAIYSSVSNNSVTIASAGIGIENGNGANTLFASNLTLEVQTTIEVDGTSLELFAPIVGPGGFIKTGASPLTLSGSTENSYTGATVVNTGVLQLNKVGAHSIGDSSALVIGTGTNAAADSDIVRYINLYGNQINVGVPITITESGLLDLNGEIDDMGPITLNGGDVSTGAGLLQNIGTVIATSTNRTPTIGGNLEMFGDSIVVDEDATFYSLVISASISDSGSGFSVINGPNTGAFARLIGSNSFTGPLTISGLTLTAETPWALGSSNGATTVGSSGNLFLFNTQITNETLILGNGSGFTAQDNCSWVGPVVLTGNTSISNWNAGMLFDINGPISGTGNLALFGPTGSTTQFSGATSNSYVGLTTVTSGDTLSLNKAFSNGAIPGNVVVNSGGTLHLARSEQIFDGANVTVDSGGLFDFSTSFESLDTLTGSGSVTFGTSGYLKIGGRNGSSTFAGLMSGTGFGGGYTVGKFGTGTFTMTANNTYQNGSDLFGGTLIVDGTEPQSPVRIMDTGTTIGGSGAIGDFVSANGSIAPGVAGSPAVFTCSNLVFTSAGNFTVRLNGANPGTGYDQLVVRGTNNLANATLTLVPSFAQAPAMNDQFTIINNQGTGPIVGTFNGMPDGTILFAGGVYFRINYNASGGNDVVLTVVGVPGNTVTFNSVARGWYDSAGDGETGNYDCGGDNVSTNLYRNWFVFNAPVSGSSIIGAELIINCYLNQSQQAGQTYLLRAVTTPIATLEAAGTGQTAIYQDLGANAVYSERSVETNESGQYAIIPLNVKFINDITAASGGQIALGGSTPLSSFTNAFLFGFSSINSNDVQLRLTYGNSVTLDAAAKGWYDNNGNHTASNPNFIAGTSVNTFHDFFMYNLPVISGPLVNAELLVNCYSVANPAGYNPYSLYDVSTPIAILTNNATGAISTFADLGSGVTYGARDIFVSENSLETGIPLDDAFVSAVYSHSGGQIALGGADASTNGYVFAGSGSSATDSQLWLGFLSAPAVTPEFVSTKNIGNNMIQLTVSGANATSNEIQGSIDFSNWDYIGDLFMTNTTSVFTYTNNYPSFITSFPYRYFRAKILP